MELVICNNGKATTTSIKVAEYFGKQHKVVLRSIENLLEDKDILGRHNFQPSRALTTIVKLNMSGLVGL